MKQRLRAWGNAKIINIASCLVFDRKGRLLLLQRHTEDLGGGYWGLPGGRLEFGEKPLQTAARELYEETGLQAYELKLLGAHMVHMPHGSIHLTSFMSHLASTPSIVTDPDEHHAYRWFEVVKLIDEPKLLWGIPTIMHDFGLLNNFVADPTLSDGSRVELASAQQADANSTSVK